LAFMGLQGRYFGRWLMPILPIACLLGAYFALALARAVADRLARSRSGGAPDAAPGPRGAPGGPGVGRALALVSAAVLVAALLAQGLLYSVHSGLVLSRADTRNQTRAWMLAHVPAGSPIVVEPVAPDEWARERRRSLSSSGDPYRWNKYPSLRSRISHGALTAGAPQLGGTEDYERPLAPALTASYEAPHYCSGVDAPPPSA